MRTSGTRPSAAGGEKRSRGRAGRVGLLAMFLAGVLAIGGTIAWVFDEADEVVNTFESAEVTCAVVENLDGAQKKDVTIKNTGDVDGYVRAAIVVNWADANGNVYGVAPVKGSDYEIVYNQGEQTDLVGKWTEGADGFWYWTNPVAGGEATGVLVTSCTYKANAPEGYYLNVEILASAIQADGADSDGTPPVVAEWGVSYDPDTKKISKA